MGDFWVFGYGSLTWRPGFDALEHRRATLYGLHRSLCVYSWAHRGTRERPGLVFGLDRGGSCRGIAFRVCASQHDIVRTYLRERELISDIYYEREWPLRLEDGSQVTALAYVVNQASPQYAGKLETHAQAAIIRGAVGKSGENPEYVISTAKKLRELSISDSRVDAVSRLLTDSV